MRKKWAVEQNNSGMGKASTLPPYLKKFNWGAALMQWVWALGNGSYTVAVILFFGPIIFNVIMVLLFGEIVGNIINLALVIAIFFYMGFKGNELAWKNKKWDSVGHFKYIQKRWVIAIIILYSILAILFIIAFVLKLTQIL